MGNTSKCNTPNLMPRLCTRSLSPSSDLKINADTNYCTVMMKQNSQETKLLYPVPNPLQYTVHAADGAVPSANRTSLESGTLPWNAGKTLLYAKVMWISIEKDIHTLL